MDKKPNSYLTLQILAPLAVAVILLVFLLAFILFAPNVNTQQGWENVSNSISLVGLIVSAITIIFLFKAYLAQREEIQNNNRNNEFNRILDLVYRQLDHSKEKYKEVLRTAPISLLTTKIINATFDHVTTLNWLFRLYCKDLELIDNFLTKTLLEQEERNLLFSTFTTNLDNDLKVIFTNFNFLLITNSALMGGDVKKLFISNLQKNINQSNLDPIEKSAKMDTEEQLYDKLIDNINLINAIHKKYNVSF